MAYTDIDNPSETAFNTVLYTGNATDNTSISVGFQPDFTWIKNRVRAGYNNRLQNSVVGSTKSLQSNRTVAEQTNADAVKSFNSDGFVLGTDDGNGSFNKSGDAFVSWNWKAGTSFTNDASATGIGTIDSTGSVNQEAGFSIISYTGIGGTNQSVAHGLGATPKYIIIKARSATSYWPATNPRFVSVSDPNMLYLNLSSGGEADDTNVNGTTAPSSTVFGVDDYGAVNTNGQTQIAYCFTPIKGYSAMSTYFGCGNANGMFIFTGFKPAYVMIRRADAGNDWLIQDSKRYPINETVAKVLKANSALAEGDTGNMDMLSNGFKLRSTGTNTNASGSPYIYMAFAENPFVTSTNNGSIPTTAR